MAGILTLIIMLFLLLPPDVQDSFYIILFACAVWLVALTVIALYQRRSYVIYAIMFIACIIESLCNKKHTTEDNEHYPQSEAW